MTMPLRPGTPGKSEFSHGKGRFPAPESDYQTFRGGDLPWGPPVEDKHDVQLQRQAELRSDPTNAEEDLSQMPYTPGNPDFYPDQKPLVEEKPNRPAAKFKQPVYKTGVNRGGY